MKVRVYNDNGEYEVWIDAEDGPHVGACISEEGHRDLDHVLGTAENNLVNWLNEIRTMRASKLLELINT